MERGLSILRIDAICGSVQNSMTPPEKAPSLTLPRLRGRAGWGRRGPSGQQAHPIRTGLPSADIPASLAEAERLRQSLPADAGRGDLLKTIIDRVELGSACIFLVAGRIAREF